jgi:hypothetical protein
LNKGQKSKQTVTPDFGQQHTFTGEALQKEITLAKFPYRAHNTNQGSVLSFHDFWHDARCPIRPHKAIKPRTQVSAAGKVYRRFSL